MQKLKHIKYTKLSPILLETVPSPVESPFCRMLENPRGVGWRSFVCRFALIDWFVGVAT